MQDLEISLPSGRATRIRIRRHPRARRIILRIDRQDGAVRVSLPRAASRAQALDFVRSRSSWIDDCLDRLPPPLPLGAGGRVPVRGRERSIVHDPEVSRPVVREESAVLRVGGEVSQVPDRVVAWLKGHAREHIEEGAVRFAREVGVAYRRVTLRDPRSRWGSCSAAGGLNFSWRLVMTPPVVLDYVVAHEVAHLRHMDHGTEFWRLVEDLVPGSRGSRRWLRQHGSELLRYDATSPA